MSCLSCEFHEVINDPDPEDWFCDDDTQVINSKYLSDRNQFKCITKSCRPYNVVKESDTPAWCPL